MPTVDDGSHDAIYEVDSRSTLGSSASDLQLPELGWWRRWSLTRRRLYGEARSFLDEARARENGAPPNRSGPWWNDVENLAVAAVVEAVDGVVSVGFEALNSARRVMLESFSTDELRAEAIAVLAEAQSTKLSEWGRAGIEALLKPFGDDAEPEDAEARALLRKALLLRDEGGQNSQRMHEVVTGRYLQLLVVVVIGVLVLLLLTWLSPLNASFSDGVGLGESRVWLYVFLFGVLGASVSAGLSLAKQTAEDERVPEIRARTIPAVFRPLFGGTAAIGSLAILSAGLLAGLPVTYGTVLTVAFLAGFSERLIDSVSRRVG